MTWQRPLTDQSESVVCLSTQQERQQEYWRWHHPPSYAQPDDKLASTRDSRQICVFGIGLSTVRGCMQQAQEGKPSEHCRHDSGSGAGKREQARHRATHAPAQGIGIGLVLSKPASFSSSTRFTGPSYSVRRYIPCAVPCQCSIPELSTATLTPSHTHA